MLKGLLTAGSGLFRIAASLRGCQRELKRIADTLEQHAPTSGGVGFRSFYRDDRPEAVEEAALFAQTDADFAALEAAENLKRRSGREPAMDEDL